MEKLNGCFQAASGCFQAASGCLKVKRFQIASELRIEKFSESISAAQRCWISMKEPSPYGKCIKKYTHETMHIVGWHAGSKSTLEYPITHGKFDRQGKDIYFGQPKVSAHFGGREADSIMLLIGTKTLINTSVNEVFGTDYIRIHPEADEDQQVLIERVHEMNPDWIKFIDPKNQLTTLQKIDKLAAVFMEKYSEPSECFLSECFNAL